MKKEIKAQNPGLNINIVDILSHIDPTPTNKYLPLLVKVFKQTIDNDMINPDAFFLDHTDFSLDGLQSLTTLEKKIMWDIIHALGGELSTTISDSNIYNLLKKFDELLEKNRIENKDISTYQNLQEISYAIDEAQITDEARKREKRIIYIYENDEWAVIMPLTWESSRKYGANTKWCTTSVEKETFFRYSASGVLFYIINKVNNQKFAMHANKNREYQWLQFYNQRDEGIDSMQIQLPNEVREIIVTFIMRYLSTLDYLVSTNDVLLLHYAEIFEKYELYDKVSIEENIKNTLKNKMCK